MENGQTRGKTVIFLNRTTMKKQLESVCVAVAWKRHFSSTSSSPEPLEYLSAFRL